jgi:xylulokinase
VADGAAKQAAWALSGKENPPNWSLGEIKEVNSRNSDPEIVESYMDLISN